MYLNELDQYDSITIQAHDNPDADAIASGYALYVYFQSKGKNVSLIYSGRYRIQKTNLKLMIDKLGIPIEYRQMQAGPVSGLLITVDCQYGAGNVYPFAADAIAVIDHHLGCGFHSRREAPAHSRARSRAKRCRGDHDVRRGAASSLLGKSAVPNVRLHAVRYSAGSGHGKDICHT